MLKYLRIRNLVILSDVEITLGDGLNLLTGETGAGKSIVVDALGLIAGARASSDVVRQGAGRAVVEAVFAQEPGIRRWLEEAGIDALEDGDPSEDDLVIRREVSEESGSRAFVNGCPVSVSTLRRLGRLLVEIHGQHQQQSLLRPRTQLDLLDAFGSLGASREAVGGAHAELQALEHRLSAVAQGRRELEERLEVLRYRLREIDAIGPRPGEDDDLRRERERLSHAVDITSLVERGREVLEGEEGSLLAGLASLEAVLAQLEPLGIGLEGAVETAGAARAQLEDVAAELRRRVDTFGPDPERLEAVEERLAALAALARRFGGSLERVLAAAEEARGELQALESDAGDPRRLEEEVEGAARRFARAAAGLSAARRKAAAALGRAVGEHLGELAMEGARLVVGVEQVESDGSRVQFGGRAVRYDATGIDRIEFLVAPNRGEPLRPLSRSASGGELSRFMLALECSLLGVRREAPSTLVFDEVDAGVGGRVAAAVGEKLHRVAGGRQVLCVTHLPQIASRADRHFQVEKRVSRGRTVTRVHALDERGRVAEIARMLGGRKVTPATRRHAEEMIARS